MKYKMNGYEWTIVLVDRNGPKLRRSDGSITVGMCDRRALEIYLCDCLSGAFLNKVLIHEICHSAMCSYGVEMTIEQEELFCDLVATFGREILDVADCIFEALAKRCLFKTKIV